MNRNTLAALSLTASLSPHSGRLRLRRRNRSEPRPGRIHAPRRIRRTVRRRGGRRAHGGHGVRLCPYNWTQMDDSNGAVPVSNVPGAYANGYDVMIAQRICDANGWELEVVSTAWDSLIPALQSGTIDVAIAGQSMTADRMAQVDMAGPYYYADIVCLTTAGSAYAAAQGIADLAGGRCTAQSGTIWYDTCLPQIPDAQIQTAAETAPAMVMQLQTGAVDFVCTDLPTATAAAANDSDLIVLNFAGTDGDFQFASEEERAENVNIGMSSGQGQRPNCWTP
ncbi:MAG: transporter substrate-binding domain-containing protein [Flavonifractor plautii]